MATATITYCTVAQPDSDMAALQRPSLDSAVTEVITTDATWKPTTASAVVANAMGLVEIAAANGSIRASSNPSPTVANSFLIPDGQSRSFTIAAGRKVRVMNA